MTWAIEFDGADAAACGLLRHEPGVEALLAAGRLWLRGQACDDRLASRLLRLPAIGRYTVTDDGALVADSTRVPRGRLPEGPWFALHCWLPLTPPPAFPVKAAAGFGSVGLTLVRGDRPGDANLLRVGFAAWMAHAVEAPAVRLERWSFAVADSGTTLVRGMPLPPLPGQRLVEEAGIAVEAGWTWSPWVSPESLRGIVGASRDDLVIVVGVTGTQELACEIVPGEAFVRATRSAVRLTARSLKEATR